jgi:phosphatidylserine decarboxylase
MATPLAQALSHFVGWAADRKLPRPLRRPIYKGYARACGADISEARGPLEIYPSLSAFFVRRLIEGARPIVQEPDRIASPVDGRVQAIGEVHDGSVLQAKGRSYSVREFLAGVGEDMDLEGGCAWTVYLSPRDYHRIHSPEAAELVQARWVPGTRYSVAPGVLNRRDVLAVNERVVLRLETVHGPLLLVLVGALNVGRIRVLGVEPAEEVQLDPGRPFERGAELARFEMGSTIVLLSPPGGLRPIESLHEGDSLRMGEALARWN